MIDSFSAQEASRLAGFNGPLMLNHLERSGIFAPEIERRKHQGKRRKYTFRDLVVLRAINRLLLLGARPKRIEEVIRTFSKVVPAINTPDALLLFCQASSSFIITEQQVLFCSNPSEIIDLAHRGQLAFAFMVDTRTSIEPMAKAVHEFSGIFDKRGVRHASVLKGVLERHGLLAR